MTEVMIEIEHIHDRLKSAEKSGWKVSSNDKVAAPRHQALLLREQFTEYLRMKEVQDSPEMFRRWARDAETACQTLEETLDGSTVDAEKASRQLQAVTANCQCCHQAFRDKPRSNREGPKAK